MLTGASQGIISLVSMLPLLRATKTQVTFAVLSTIMRSNQPIPPKPGPWDLSVGFEDSGIYGAPFSSRRILATFTRVGVTLGPW